MFVAWELCVCVCVLMVRLCPVQVEVLWRGERAVQVNPLPVTEALHTPAGTVHGVFG